MIGAATMRRWVTPGGVSFVAWMLLTLFLGIRLGEGAVSRWRGDPLYFCSYGSECMRENRLLKRCCLNVPDDEAGNYRTDVPTCKVACGVTP